MEIRRLDHLVITTRDVDATSAFYSEVLGMREVTFGAGRRALVFGDQKINLHQLGQEIDPKARVPTVGSADLCFIVDSPISQIIEELNSKGVAIELGPVPRTGAKGPITSVYVRDLDGNLIEISSYNEST